MDPGLRQPTAGAKTDKMPGRVGVLHLLSDNPGEYEMCGALDGQWNRIVWKTDAFNNNPLKGVRRVP